MGQNTLGVILAEFPDDNWVSLELILPAEQCGRNAAAMRAQRCRRNWECGGKRRVNQTVCAAIPFDVGPCIAPDLFWTDRSAQAPLDVCADLLGESFLDAGGNQIINVHGGDLP